MIITLTIMKRASAQVRVVVRGRIELPTFRFSGIVTSAGWNMPQVVVVPRVCPISA
jgi:hypothetical protein